jgi:hypothetical protein
MGFILKKNITLMKSLAANMGVSLGKLEKRSIKERENNDCI